MFDRLVAVYRAIEFDDDSRSGTLTVADEALCQILTELLADDVVEDTGLRLDEGDPTRLAVGQQLRVTAGDPKLAYGLLATDVEQLLLRPKERLKEPRSYYVIRESFASIDANAGIPAPIKKYRQALCIVDLLNEAAEYLDERNATLIFLGEEKFEVPILFTVSEMMAVDDVASDRLLRDFSDPNDVHRNQKLALLAKAARSIAGSAAPEMRFSALLTRLPELQKCFADGYRLFAADFSYDKVMNQIEAAKVEEIGRIHKAFSDIQNQILAIPVATVIVATQMKDAPTIGYPFWVNTAVLLGCYVFAALTILVLRNQLHTLGVIGDEITRKKKQMAEQYSDVADLVTQSFPALYTRLRAQKFALWLVGAILVIGVVLAQIVYIVLTVPVATWLASLWRQFSNLHC